MSQVQHTKLSTLTMLGLIAFGRVEGEEIHVDVYDPWTGIFTYNATVPKTQWDAVLPNGLQEPALVYMAGILSDRPIMQDFLGTVNESDALLQVLQFNVVPATPHLPEGFLYISSTSRGPIVLETVMPEEGVYHIHLGGGADFEPTHVQETEEFEWPDEAEVGGQAQDEEEAIEELFAQVTQLGEQEDEKDEEADI
jgi:hypothetical protein